MSAPSSSGPSAPAPSAPAPSAPARGPDGSVQLPPDWLERSSLPLTIFARGTVFHRVHRIARHPVFFGPGPGGSPTYRFDSASGLFGILYMAPGLDAAVIETLLRQPQRRMVDFAEVAVRSASTLIASRDLRLVSAHGPYLSQIGATAALFTGSYDPCGIWSDALYRHPDNPDGILYTSRHNPEEFCIALFERADLALTVTSGTELVNMLSQVARILDRHGKSLSGFPADQR